MECLTRKHIEMLGPALVGCVDSPCRLAADGASYSNSHAASATSAPNTAAARLCFTASKPFSRLRISFDMFSAAQISSVADKLSTSVGCAGSP